MNPPGQSKKLVAESLGLISTAFSLVAALAWNDAIREFINQFIGKGQSVLSHFLYAIIVTIVAVLIGSRLLKIKERFVDNNNGRS